MQDTNSQKFSSGRRAKKIGPINKAKKDATALSSRAKQVKAVRQCKSLNNDMNRIGSSKPAMCRQVKALLRKEANAFHTLNKLRELTRLAVRMQLQFEG